MKFVFVHHEVHGPISLDGLWAGTHGFGGSVARLRILFWIASRGHEVELIGNVIDGELRGVRAIGGAVRPNPITEDTVLVLNNPPTDDIWVALAPNIGRAKVLLWCGNPFEVKWMQRSRAGCPDRIVCVSQNHRDMYRIYPGFSNVEMLYSGIDLDLLDQVEPNQAANGALLFCSIPRRTKGFHNLLHAWRLVRQTLPDARLRVCGSALMHDPSATVGRTGVLDVDLEEEFSDFFLDYPGSAARSSIELLGAKTVSEVYSEMKGAAVVAVNCNWEGSFETYCRAAVEAEAAGVPVVGAARGSLPEVIASGRSGLLVNESSPKKLAEVIIKLLDDSVLRATLGAQGPAWVAPLADYELLAEDWERVAERTYHDEMAPSQPQWRRDLLRNLGYGYARAWARNAVRGSALEHQLLRFINRGAT